MNLFESFEIVQKIADDIEEIYEIDNLEAFKLAIEFWKGQSLHEIKESLSKNGTLVNKIDIISDALYDKL
jgi:hypothetical protein